eukprot:m.378877 g.378877  ORF g.378877 m.378877 type:complete len:748 (+) comp16708_c5_seq13:64-2307(+)
MTDADSPVDTSKRKRETKDEVHDPDVQGQGGRASKRNKPEQAHGAGGTAVSAAPPNEELSSGDSMEAEVPTGGTAALPAAAAAADTKEGEAGSSTPSLDKPWKWKLKVWKAAYKSPSTKPLDKPWDQSWTVAADWIQAFYGPSAGNTSEFNIWTGAKMCDMSEAALKSRHTQGDVIYDDIQTLQGANSADPDLSWVTSDLPKLSEPKVGDLVTIPELGKGGLKSNSGEKFFVRAPKARLFRDLMDIESGHLKVVGPPGTGKSTTVWLSALHKARTGSRVLWIHIARELECAVCIMKVGKIVTPKGLLPANVAEAQILQCLEDQDFDLIVLDGVTRNPIPVYQNIQSALRTYTHNKIQEGTACTLIYCASQSLRTDGSTNIPSYFLDGTAAPVVMSAPPWSLQEFKDAVAHPEFWSSIQDVVADVPVPETIANAKAAAATSAGYDSADPVDPAAAVENKFLVSGASARWMFGMSTEDVILDCDRYIEEVHDVETIIGHRQGTANPNAINHLQIVNNNGVRSLISDYATRSLLRWNELHTMALLTDISSKLMEDNPAFDGWVLELDFLTQIKAALNSRKGQEATTIKLFRSANSDVASEQWNIAGVTTKVTLAGVIDPHGLELEFMDGWWFIPKKYNQGGYDAMQLYTGVDGKLCARFVNVTRSDKHDIKCQYCIDLLTALKLRWDAEKESDFPITAMEFVWVRPFGCEVNPIVSSLKDSAPLTWAPPNGYSWDEAPSEVFIKRSGQIL